MKNIIRKQFYLNIVLLLTGLLMINSCAKQTVNAPAPTQTRETSAEVGYASDAPQSSTTATDCRLFAAIKDDAVKFDVSSKEIIYIAPVSYTAESVDNLIYCSIDSGKTASLIYETDRDASDAPLDFQVYSVYFFDSKNGVALGAAVHPINLYSTSDGGTTWRNELLSKESKDIVLPVGKFGYDANLESAIPWGASTLTAIGNDEVRVTVPYMESNKKYYNTSICTKDGFHEESQEYIDAGDGISIATKEEIDNAVSAYKAFLQGDAEAKDPKHDLSESENVNINDLSLGLNTLYALFDMNGDGIPELHLRPTMGGGYEIFTYRDSQVVLWYVNADYCSSLNNGALLYERPGGAPPHTNYMYITLDTNGNEIVRVEFSKYDVVDKRGLKVGVKYIYQDNDVSKETWDELTKKFLSIKSDLIKWIE